MGAQLSVTDMRRAMRHPIDHAIIGEHRKLGDVPLRIINISLHGFMTAEELPLGRGERIVIALPVIGRIEAHLIWSSQQRTGFQFERILRTEDFDAAITLLQPNPQLRPRR